jgi:lipase chaperone LimK
MKYFTKLAFVLVALFALQPALAADEAVSATHNMDILREKLKADKKLVVAENMGLSEAEATVFWPVYERYQNGLANLYQRLAALFDSYATDYNADSLTDEKARVLIDEMIAIEADEAELKKLFVPQLEKVLPMKKVARYLQIENKIQIMVNYELAEQVPLVR